MIYSEINKKVVEGATRLDIISDELIYIDLHKIKCRAIVSSLKPHNVISVSYIGVDSGSIKNDIGSFTSFHKNKWIYPLEILKNYDGTIDYLISKHKYLSQLINKKTLKIREEIKEKELNKRFKYK